MDWDPVSVGDSACLSPPPPQGMDSSPHPTELSGPLVEEQELSDAYLKEVDKILKFFSGWNQSEQTEFVKTLIKQMGQHQHGVINAFLRPMLQRDFVSLLPTKGCDHVAEVILSYLDAKSLCAAELVCKEWSRVVADGMLWKKLIQRKTRTDPLWRGLSERRNWSHFLFNKMGHAHPDHRFFRKLYPRIINDIDNLETNWRSGKHTLQRINCRSEGSKGVYCLQYDEQKIVSGLRDNTIKIWDRASLQCTQVLTGHTGSVLCLQYDDLIIVTGSSDSTVRVWDVKTGEMVNTLIHHCEAVLHLRFQNGMMVTCSKDRSIAVWDMVSPREINLRRVLVGHRAAVNVVDFDERYIVSASGDRTIKVWNTSTCEFVRTLNGHKRGIACLQYRDRLVVSGSSDNSIRLWDIETGSCLRVLEGHEELVRCIRFDSKRIVSGAYDGKIKVWDLKAALDPRAPAATLCLRTLMEHTGRVFRLQFDEFQIVSSSHDDTILIWDFLNFDRNASSNEFWSNMTSTDGHLHLGGSSTHPASSSSSTTSSPPPSHINPFAPFGANSTSSASTTPTPSSATNSRRSFTYLGEGGAPPFAPPTSSAPAAQSVAPASPESPPIREREEEEDEDPASP
ncbi:unnamed protein product [Cyprideis torosa]|uniref:Uncharacterized protein n=1 Tax=Cyprideis torosa TaxID=163714 RepID=A0A7R8ZLU6_9CRUS|nr:unnamed protein product [Cyprideis torosa]CAG0894089.1 unnamed protein product [Cyprideis torosa]